MNKIFLLLLWTNLTLMVGCQSNETRPVQQMAAMDTSAGDRLPVDTTQPPAAVTRDNESSATEELCACLTPLFADMSPQVRAILVKAGKSSSPIQTLTIELQQVQGAAEQERLFREMEKFESDFQLQRCSESIKQKYNLDETDVASREKVLKAAESNRSCEVVYALMKIGLEQEKNAAASGKLQ